MPTVTIEKEGSSNDKVITFILEGGQFTPHILHNMGIHIGVKSVHSREKNTILSISCEQRAFYSLAVLAMSKIEDEISGVNFTTNDNDLARMFKSSGVSYVPLST